MEVGFAVVGEIFFVASELEIEISKKICGFFFDGCFVVQRRGEGMDGNAHNGNRFQEIEIITTKVGVLEQN